MKHFKSVSFNRWLTGILCLSLLVSILTSPGSLILRGVAAQEAATPKVGSKFATDLPDLTRIRYQSDA
jgi:hypothetical protein